LSLLLDAGIVSALAQNPPIAHNDYKDVYCFHAAALLTVTAALAVFAV